MWYVIQVQSGSEKRTIALIRRLAATDSDGAPLFSDLFVPEAEQRKHLDGEWRTVRRTLMPGYVFAVTDRAAALADRLRGVSAFTRMLGGGDAFIPLTEAEVALMQQLMDPASHAVGMSEAVREGDAIVVVSGPLKGREALIVKVDRHHRSALVRLELMNRAMTVKVGLEILAKRQEPDTERIRTPRAATASNFR